MKNDARVNLKINEPEGGKGMGGGMSANAGAGEAAAEEEPNKSLDDAIDDLKI
jgi:hypothetical protein